MIEPMDGLTLCPRIHCPGSRGADRAPAIDKFAGRTVDTPDRFFVDDHTRGEGFHDLLFFGCNQPKVSECGFHPLTPPRWSQPWNTTWVRLKKSCCTLQTQKTCV